MKAKLSTACVSPADFGQKDTWEQTEGMHTGHSSGCGLPSVDNHDMGCGRTGHANIRGPLPLLCFNIRSVFVRPTIRTMCELWHVSLSRLSIDEVVVLSLSLGFSSPSSIRFIS